MKIKRRLSLLLAGLVLMSSMTAFAETKTFSFIIYPNGYSNTSTNPAKKADSEQKAYITPTSISGSGRVWACIYGTDGNQKTVDIGFEPSEVNVKKTAGYYITGVAGNYYYLSIGDGEGEVTSSYLYIAGRYTP